MTWLLFAVGDLLIVGIILGFIWCAVRIRGRL